MTKRIVALVAVLTFAGLTACSTNKKKTAKQSPKVEQSMEAIGLMSDYRRLKAEEPGPLQAEAMGGGFCKYYSLLKDYRALQIRLNDSSVKPEGLQAGIEDAIGILEKSSATAAYKEMAMGHILICADKTGMVNELDLVTEAVRLMDKVAPMPGTTKFDPQTIRRAYRGALIGQVAVLKAELVRRPESADLKGCLAQVIEDGAKWGFSPDELGSNPDKVRKF